MKDDEWRDVMSVVLDGAFYCTRAVLPLMRAQKDGTIINISSYLALRGAKGVANYAAAKAGLITLTKVTALEEGPHNIRANVVIPGFHVTDMNKDVWAKIEEDVMSDHLLGRLPDRDELGGFVVSLALLKSVTGQVFPFESRLM
jgi:NAD(P)-dependent dehydrogenase (short-subunit alcohol dehydrogenase family)